VGGAGLQFSRRFPFSIPIEKVTLRLGWYRFPVSFPYGGNTSSSVGVLFWWISPFLAQLCGVGPPTDGAKPSNRLYTAAEGAHGQCARISRAWLASNKFLLLFGNINTGCSLALFKISELRMQA